MTIPSTIPTNTAAFYTAPRARPFQISPAPTPALSPYTVLIRNHFVAINPADALIQSLGILVTSFPSILGCDAAGTVLAVGSAVTRFKPGDRVLAMIDSSGGLSKLEGTFQTVFATVEKRVARIPDGMEFRDACVLPLGIATAAGALFEGEALGLRLPRVDGEAKDDGREKEEILVVWGGSGSVGSCAIQLARAAGYVVFAMAGEHNFEYCRDLGAKMVFDHKSKSVVEDIVEAIQKQDKQCVGVYDAVPAPETILKSAEIVRRVSGRKIVATVLGPGLNVPDGFPDDVQSCAGPGLKSEAIRAAIWDKWLPAALDKDQMKCKPDPFVVGKGLESIQEACDLMTKGVSAKKLVVEL